MASESPRSAGSRVTLSDVAEGELTANSSVCSGGGNAATPPRTPPTYAGLPLTGVTPTHSRRPSHSRPGAVRTPAAAPSGEDSDGSGGNSVVVRSDNTMTEDTVQQASGPFRREVSSGRGGAARRSLPPGHTRRGTEGTESGGASPGLPGANGEQPWAGQWAGVPLGSRSQQSGSDLCGDELRAAAARASAELAAEARQTARWRQEAEALRRQCKELAEELTLTRRDNSRLENSLFDLASEKAQWGADAEQHAALRERFAQLQRAQARQPAEEAAALRRQLEEKTQAVDALLAEHWTLQAEAQGAAHARAAALERLAEAERDTSAMREAMEEAYAMARRERRLRRQAQRREPLERLHLGVQTEDPCPPPRAGPREQRSAPDG